MHAPVVTDTPHEQATSEAREDAERLGDCGQSDVPRCQETFGSGSTGVDV